MPRPITDPSLRAVRELQPPRDAAVAERRVPTWGPTTRTLIRLSVAVGICGLASLTMWRALGDAAQAAVLAANAVLWGVLWNARRVRRMVRRGRMATCAIAQAVTEPSRRPGAHVDLRYVLEVDGKRYPGRCRLPSAALPQLPDPSDRALVVFDPRWPRRHLVWGLHFLDGQVLIPR